MKKVYAFLGILLLFSLPQLFAVTIDESVSGVDRYAIYIGANNGGKSRERLLYAGSDAKSFRDTMTEIGGVTENQSLILIDPSKEKIDEALKEISNKITSKSGHAKRSEFIFYYSGHSDENALLLGETKYDYSKLKAAITEVPSDIHVVILDSCYSGNFIRTKGGQKRKPFLIDDSSVVTGHAYLSSSSDNESSQESDEIESSYFTNAMITGLRGAADTSGDNKVTLNELYSYAFNDTLSKTETSKAGPQHPNYNITLVGSGDLVLSDLTAAEAMLSLSKDAKGKFIIRDANDKLVSEINKLEGQPIFMALPAGQYTATIIDEYSSRQGIFYLNKDQVYVLDQNSLSAIKRKTARLRGNEQLPEEDDEEALSAKNTKVVIEDEEVLPVEELPAKKKKKQELPELVDDSEDISEFQIESTEGNGLTVSVVPGVAIWNPTQDANFSIGILGAKIHNLNGVQISNLLNIADGSVHGVQISGLSNMNLKNQNGVQIAGIFNIGNNLSGSQVGGIFNIATNVEGSQIGGVFNLATDIRGPQVGGVFNLAETINGAQISGVVNCAKIVNGSQLGVINIAEENNGITFGLLNLIGNGLFDVGITVSSDSIVDTFFQNGSKKLYTIYGFQQPFDNAFNHPDFASVYMGFGSQVKFNFTSFEFEFLWKMYYFEQDVHPEYSYLKDLSVQKIIESISVPSIRFNWNALENPFVSLFLSTSFDFNTVGYNDIPFDLYKHNGCIKYEDNRIYTSFAVGIKTHF